MSLQLYISTVNVYFDNKSTLRVKTMLLDTKCHHETWPSIRSNWTWVKFNHYKTQVLVKCKISQIFHDSYIYIYIFHGLYVYYTYKINKNIQNIEVLYICLKTWICNILSVYSFFIKLIVVIIIRTFARFCIIFNSFFQK